MRRVTRNLVPVLIALVLAAGCRADALLVRAGPPVPSPARSSAAAAPATPPPPADPCADYADLEAGHGAPERQDLFNHLDARGYARWRMACVYRWGADEYGCLDTLWTEESGWYEHADGAGSTWGIPQAYPGDKMRSAGPDWRDNPRVQVRWGLDYIAGRYRLPSRTPHRCHAGY